MSKRVQDGLTASKIPTVLVTYTKLLTQFLTEITNFRKSFIRMNTKLKYLWKIFRITEKGFSKIIIIKIKGGTEIPYLV